MKSKEVVTYVLIIALLCLLFKKNMYEGVENMDGERYDYDDRKGKVCMAPMTFFGLLFGGMGMFFIMNIIDDGF